MCVPRNPTQPPSLPDTGARLHAHPPDPSQPESFLEVLDTTTNLGPIVDFCVVDLDRQGQGQVVTCSGGAGDGSLRIVRSGIGVLPQATVELPSLKGVWNLRRWGQGGASPAPKGG